MDDLLFRFSQFSDIASVAVAFAAVAFSVLAALRSGALRTVRFGPLEIEAAAKGVAEAREIVKSISSPDSQKLPFETEQLANYYAQVLGQSKVSFWFSLVFASVGFLIIVLAAFMHANAESSSTIARFIAGGIVDAVAALFFVQSKRAQESMADFFDKLRRDRNHMEARKLCEGLEAKEARDALKVRLALHYAEVASPDSIAESIIKSCLQRPS
ncbi:hypothetical protein IB232_10265 [Pseudomonas sp. PDM15]|uniref:TRADD-N-associated membrane domain-containing protein n=1 Tax=Pseudomonas sp. PDM15 TaxID=2769303 RepID=UPI001781F696|nr:hypothetical protein [Pseudomonas sp. PDM15]MBD9425703.1 hypothetical protein [Pseudomonas sp. PDM15]